MPRDAAPSSVALVCIYRRDNAALVRALLGQLPPGAVVRLWALDSPDVDLEPLTVGVGPGLRLSLLNALIETLPVQADMLVVVDDDVRFVVGDIRRLVHAGAALGLDLFQPSHSAQSKTAFPFVMKRPLSFARLSTFVEQGPVVVLSRHAQTCLLPLPGELGMGWGIEARWAKVATDSGLRLGVIDAVSIRHFGQPGHTYDTSPEFAQLQRELAAVGLSDLRQLQTEVEHIGVMQAWIRMRRAAPRQDGCHVA